MYRFASQPIARWKPYVAVPCSAILPGSRASRARRPIGWDGGDGKNEMLRRRKKEKKAKRRASKAEGAQLHDAIQTAPLIVGREHKRNKQKETDAAPAVIEKC